MIPDRTLLAVWEASRHISLLEKSLMLLSCVRADSSVSEIAEMPIGERDALLLEVREDVFGQSLLNTATCPSCGQKVEWAMRVDELRVQPAEVVSEGKIVIEYNGHQIHCRLPNSEDIMQVMTIEGKAAREDALLKNCVAQSLISPELANDLPDDLKMAILQKMEACDPQADLTFAMQCPECGHQWELPFDIMSYLWAEIDEWAMNLVQEVGLLARNFGWSERDILEMGMFRRRLYVNMLLI